MDNPKDSTGRWRTRSLFVELIAKEQLAAGFLPIFTLKGDKKYVDLHEMYIDEADPTGYSFALRAFGSWEHFCVLRELQWFKAHFTKWEDELEVKMRSDGIKNLIEASKEGSRGVSAAKYIAEKGWEKKRGRPSKDEIERERKQQVLIDDELQADAQRIGLH